jgi:RNA polymerase sigma-70 factor (ECF subfamily)
MADVADLEAWIFRVARSALTDAWRAERRRATRDADVDPDDLAEDAEQSSDDRAEISRCMRPFIDALAPTYRRALELTTVGGLTQAAAARSEGVSLSGMKSRVQRARAAVLRDIQQCCGLQRDARGIVRGLGSADGTGCTPASFHQIQRRQK